MKTIKLIMFSIGMMILLSSVAAAQKNKDRSGEESTKSFSVDKGGKLVVNVNPGDIVVSTSSKNEVTIRIRGLDRDDLNDVEMKQSGNAVYVTYNSDWGSDGEFYINVPSQFNVELKTTAGDIKVTGNLYGDAYINTQGGDIKTQNIKGKTKINTQGGDVTLGDIDGSLYVNTMGGEIRIGSIRGDYADVNTMGGEIHIKDVSSGIKAKTMGGDITLGNIGGDATVTTFGGNITLDKVSGSATMETYGGNLSLSSASGKVQAKTAGGNIDLSNVSGSVNAKTAAGNINVELYPSGKGESKLYTANGSIELYVPGNARATIVATIKVHGGWRHSRDAYKIYSDFESKSYSSDNDDKEITATYVLNGGGDKIYLNTSNSDIRIRKISK